MKGLFSLLDALVALICSVFSGMGLGGGSLILMYLTEIRRIPQADAQAIGLLLFLATATAAAPTYLRMGLLGDGKVLLRFLPGGILFALIGAQIGIWLPHGILRRLFGFFLLFVGARGVYLKIKKPRREQPEDSETEGRP